MENTLSMPSDRGVKDYNFHVKGLSLDYADYSMMYKYMTMIVKSLKEEVLLK